MIEDNGSNSAPLSKDEEEQMPTPSSMADATSPDLAAESVSRPTHRIKGMKVGNYGVQFFVTAKEQLYDIEDVTGGDGGFQTVGNWDDKTIAQVADKIRQQNIDRISQKPTTHSATMGEGGRRLGSNSYSSGPN